MLGITQVTAAIGLSIKTRRWKPPNKLPKHAITGVCGNLFGNQFDFAGIQHGRSLNTGWRGFSPDFWAAW
jgi:hypothetical protein